MEYTGIDPLKYLIEMVEEMRKDIADLKAKADLRAYSLREIADSLGCNAQSLRNKPWKMPNFGRADLYLGQQTRKWYYETIKNWYALPENERRRQWEMMTSRERREALGEIKVTNKASPDRATGFHILEDGSTAKAG